MTSHPTFSTPTGPNVGAGATPTMDAATRDDIDLQMQRRAKAGSVRDMFGRIAGRYDLLNDLMTLGRHRAWKRATVAACAPRGAVVLDLGCGTGDLSRLLVQREARSVIGGDFTQEMLVEAERLAREADIPPHRLRFTLADALDLPFSDSAFDVVVSGFLVRNVADRDLALREMYRVLQPGGRVVCLEASRRDGVVGRLLHGAFGISAPILGWLIARDRDAYRYLPDSAQHFASPPELAASFAAAGFHRVQWRSYGLGMIAIHRAWKPRVAR